MTIYRDARTGLATRARVGLCHDHVCTFSVLVVPIDGECADMAIRITGGLPTEEYASIAMGDFLERPFDPTHPSDFRSRYDSMFRTGPFPEDEQAFIDAIVDVESGAGAGKLWRDEAAGKDIWVRGVNK
jgi:hypothetical protein